MPASPSLIASLRSSLTECREMAAAIGERVTLDSWLATELQTLRGDEARETEAACRAIWAEQE